ncbi:gamma-glutamylcyclotransferase family protein [Allobaculum sp. JKK-2023]|uniref:gamma-glutamylcyclotransferase family protein n=1 Tax=Allobaculum sp. JKK-2023 TaxID=3108943 RepID=UPI002B05CC4A|nr:gamma-glutamylcyclotransferase family protein [Allobaculum sp. JKK-2023]
MKLYYLAYGSNLNLDQMERRAPTAKVYGSGWLPDHQLVMRGIPGRSYLDVIPSPSSKVPVGCFCMEDSDLSSLDEYEGYPDLYKRKTIELPIHKPDGSVCVLECFYYQMVTDDDLAPCSKFYFEECLQGYQDFCFDQTYLANAYAQALHSIRQEQDLLKNCILAMKEKEE